MSMLSAFLQLNKYSVSQIKITGGLYKYMCRRQHGRVVRAMVLKSGGAGFEPLLYMKPLAGTVFVSILFVCF